MTLAEKLVAIHAAEDLLKKHSQLLNQIRIAHETFSVFVGGQSQKHMHEDLNEQLKAIWIVELRALVQDVESEIMACTFETLYRNFEAEG